MEVDEEELTEVPALQVGYAKVSKSLKVSFYNELLVGPSVRPSVHNHFLKGGLIGSIPPAHQHHSFFGCVNQLVWML